MRICWFLSNTKLSRICPRQIGYCLRCSDCVRCPLFRINSTICLSIPLGAACLSCRTGDSFNDSHRKYKGRMIYYHVVDDDGNFDNTSDGPSFHFKGHGLEELTDKLVEETGLEDIMVCSVNKVNVQLYPLRLGLPPNNATMHVVVVPSTSKAVNATKDATDLVAKLRAYHHTSQTKAYKKHLSRENLEAVTT